MKFASQRLIFRYNNIAYQAITYCTISFVWFCCCCAKCRYNIMQIATNAVTLASCTEYSNFRLQNLWEEIVVSNVYRSGKIRIWASFILKNVIQLYLLLTELEKLRTSNKCGWNIYIESVGRIVLPRFLTDSSN